MSNAALATYTQVAQDFWGNPSSHHEIGNRANGLLQHCRQTITDLMQVPLQSVIFTSGGSQSNELAIRMALQQLAANHREILVSPIEHASVHHILAGQPNITIRQLPLNAHGQATPALLAKAITAQTGLIILQAVNSVTGIIQPIAELATIAAEHGILFHCDGVQAFTKYDVPTHVSSYSASSHKIYGPKGTGLLYLNPNVPYQPLYPGTTHEFGFRPGTIDVPSIAAFTTAVQAAYASRTADFKHYEQLRKQLLQALPEWSNLLAYETFPGIVGIFSPEAVGNKFVDTLHEQGFAISTTSACNDFTALDPAIMAAGIDANTASRFARVSFGTPTTTEEVMALTNALLSLQN
jgi:cysteine desulfurase